MGKMILKTKGTVKKVVLIASSKRKEDLTSFLSCLKKLSLIATCEVYVKTKSNKKSIFSVLKSPHINKTAQEQFQKKKHSCSFVLNPNPRVTIELLLFIKSLLSSRFSGINLRVLLVTSHESETSHKKSAVMKKIDYQKVNGEFCYLSLLDAEGESANLIRPVKYKKHL